MSKEYQTPLDKATVVHVGTSWKDKTEFVMRSALPISESMALQEQIRLGFHPRGFGFYQFKCVQLRDDLHEARWVTSGSCD